jgi:hypothetical protein
MAKQPAAPQSPAAVEDKEAQPTPAAPGTPGGPATPGGENEQPLTLKDVVGHLVKAAKGKGVVTYDQLNALLPDAVNDPEQLDQILEQLEAKGIELVE